jgi:hypothetical protein
VTCIGCGDERLWLSKKPCGSNDEAIECAASKDANMADELVRRLEMLKMEHRDLDSAVGALMNQPILDQLQLARLKKRKLKLRDEIAMIEDQLIPDIIA